MPPGRSVNRRNTRLAAASMSIVLYEGAAGTGKTTSLLDAATTWLADHELHEGQRILLLTFTRRAAGEMLRRDETGMAAG